ncbi:F-type H+-transporting ATPase subunit a [Ereboglobus sp. PH5-5]|uniref:F0F1 ATP synthase subunit A n=1 Tax=Ereboglobus sp. PH5-5 TaxID=2940529 RepID=UPI0024076163|nr:F0F1 ATP synthase subunit A [Ereboglobus sp. PH5-5]MDF9832222.1 F-type H+-transporting ATPase subunit a [Ereboglobus sp. PH5-5]
MSRGKITTLALSVFAFATAAFASGAEDVSAKAAILIDFGNGWTISNSMATGWLVSLAIICVVIFALRRPQIFPSKMQAVFETLIESLRGLFEPIVGKKAFPAVFPLLITLFVFILLQNWMGLLPGVGTMGFGHDVDGHFHLTTPLVRPFTADFNGAAALAIVSFVAFLIIIFKYAGAKAVFYDWFGNKADKKETPRMLYYMLSIVFLLVGFIEVFSVAIRPITLSVRLFGNIFGGESLLHGTGYFFIFYFLELLVGLIQALVFTLLSATYIGLICNHDDGEHNDDSEKHHPVVTPPPPATQ